MHDKTILIKQQRVGSGLYHLFYRYYGTNDIHIQLWDGPVPEIARLPKNWELT